MTSPTNDRLYHAAPSSAFTALGAIGVAFAAWATWLVASIVVVRTLGPGAVVGAVAIGQLALLAIALVAMRLARKDRRALGLARPRARFIAAAALVGSSMWFVNMVIVSLLPLDTDDSPIRIVVDAPPLWQVLVVVVALPAVCEEVVFRGVLLRGLASRFYPVIAVIGSALAFGLYHVYPPQMIATFLLALALGWIALRGGSALPAMLAHALNNGFAVLLVRGELPWLASEDKSGLVDRQPLVVLAAALTLTIGGLVLASFPHRAAAP
jgi:membrane protease YdiL (CAAX protease family)